MTRIDYLRNKIKSLERDIDAIDKFLNKDENKIRKDKIIFIIRKQRRLSTELKVAYSIELIEREMNESKFGKYRVCLK